jgi:GDP-4-dehydro-6-deoxy-D-mannose reductase
MNILLTGGSGFVAQHFINFLEKNKIYCDVIALYNSHKPVENKFRFVRLNYLQCNMKDFDSVLEVVRLYNPNYIVHLAAQSSVAESWKHPLETFNSNISFFINLCESLKVLNLDTRILSVGSAEVYGSENGTPITENETCNPQNPYGIARLTQEKLMHLYVKNYNLKIIGTRSFNHIGPMQMDKFVISSFANQIHSQAKLGKKIIDLIVGNIHVVRDFMDVRDVAVAYFLLMTKGNVGEIYNVSSGKGISIKSIIELMAKINNVEVKMVVSQDKIRPYEIPIIIGDNSLIKKELNWMPKINLKETIIDVFSELDKNKSV